MVHNIHVSGGEIGVWCEGIRCGQRCKKDKGLCAHDCAVFVSLCASCFGGSLIDWLLCS